MKQTKQRRGTANRTAARLAALTVPLSLAAIAAGPSPAPAGAKASEFLVEDAGFTYSINSSSLDFPRINDLGQVVAPVEQGKRYLGGKTNASLTNIQTIQPLQGDVRTTALDINSDSVVVGASAVSQGSSRAIRNLGNLTEPLGFEGEGEAGEATAINDTGDIVGSVASLFGAPQAFFKPLGAPVQRITSGSNWAFAEAVDISDTGIPLVNALGVDDQDQRAYRYIDGEMRSVGVIPGADFSQGYAINDANAVAGESGGFPRANPRAKGTQWPPLFQLPNPRGGQGGFVRAFRATLGGAPQDLGALAPTEFSVGYGINASGNVVGQSGARAFLYTDQRGIRDLNALIPSESGWQLQTATGINSRGQIVGLGRLNQQLRVFRLTPRGNPVTPLGIGPGRIDFGRIGVGRYGQSVVTLRNTGETPVSGFITSTGAPYLIRLPENPDSGRNEQPKGNPVGDFFVVGPGDVLRVRVYYVPRRRQTDRGFVIVETDPDSTPPGGNRRTRIRLTGRGC